MEGGCGEGVVVKVWYIGGPASLQVECPFVCMFQHEVPFLSLARSISLSHILGLSLSLSLSLSFSFSLSLSLSLILSLPLSHSVMPW